ncbi:MAG TPA: DUF1697 domain-containing protein [Actinomycetota bacterium]|nr:DUF1697 domain-containing protein [Actinomycetota bacterium]
MARFVALLRGINVGGKHLIKMPALKAAFEGDGFENVSTYIQSGNVLFDTSGRGGAALADRIEAMLESTFEIPLVVVVRSRAQLRAVVDRAPEGFGSAPGRYLYDVVFLKEPLTAKTAIKSLSMKEGVDEAYSATGVLYLRRLSAKAVQSRLNRIASLPIYKNMTIRNWNTTTKLLQLLES